MVQGSWVGGPFPDSFFFFLSVFRSSSPMNAYIARDGVGGFTLYASISFLFLAVLPCLYFLFLSLALMSANPAIVGVGIRLTI